MAIIDWAEIWNGRRGDLDNFKSTRRYERVFRAITDSSGNAAAEIFTETQLPGWLAPYEDADGNNGDEGAVLKSVRIEQEQGDNPNVWLVHCEFSSEELDPQQRDQIEDPLSRPPIWSLETQKFQRVLMWDVYGTPIQNSAGVPFSPLPEYDDSRFILTCERNELTPSWGLLLTYKDSVNSDGFLGFAPGIFKFASFHAQAMYENGLYYYKMHYTFEGRPYVNINSQGFSDWDVHLLDQGLTQLDSSGVLVDIYDKHGTPISEPTKLDGAGHAFMNGGVVNGDAVFCVTAIQLTNGGYGYDVSKGAPTVTIAGGGGSGATAVAFTGNQQGIPANPYDQRQQQIIFIQLTNPGTGYTSAPTVTISAPQNSNSSKAQATATAVIGIVPQYLHYRPYNWLPYAAFNFPGTIT